MNALATTTPNPAALWRQEELQDIKEMFAPTLSETEFKAFVGLGANLGANPFTREIWAVKYGSGAAQIFLGRDFYRKKAQQQENYDGHTVDAVYQNDSFTVENGLPKHSYQIGDRGALIGAYCVVYLKNARVPYFVFCDFKEYSTGKSLWATNGKPATMIKKVAEAQGLRGAFQGVFSGTYSEVEQWEEKTAPETVMPQVIEPVKESMTSALAEVKAASDRKALNAIWKKYGVFQGNPDFSNAVKDKAESFKK